MTSHPTSIKLNDEVNEILKGIQAKLQCSVSDAIEFLALNQVKTDGDRLILQRLDLDSLLKMKTLNEVRKGAFENARRGREIKLVRAKEEQIRLKNEQIRLANEKKVVEIATAKKRLEAIEHRNKSEERFQQEFNQHADKIKPGEPFPTVDDLIDMEADGAFDELFYVKDNGIFFDADGCYRSTKEDIERLIIEMHPETLPQKWREKIGK